MTGVWPTLYALMIWIPFYARWIPLEFYPAASQAESFALCHPDALRMRTGPAYAVAHATGITINCRLYKPKGNP